MNLFLKIFISNFICFNIYASSLDLTYSAPAAIDFTRLKADLSRNGINETIECGDGKVIIRKKNDNEAYSWDYTSDRLSEFPNHRRVVANCSIVKLAGKVNAVVTSTHWGSTDGSQPAPSEQFIIFRKWTGDKEYVRETVKVNGSLYQPVSRSVKCISLPSSAITQNNKAGSLCFYSAYNQVLGGIHKTRTALLKVEKYRDGIIFNDATAATELPWTGGVTGSSTLGMWTPCSGLSRYDGIHMMDSTFVRQDTGSLPILITAGQHASLRSHQLTLDSSKVFGIRFVTNIIVNAQCGNDSEYLSVTAMNEYQNAAANGCFYVTGEEASEGGAFISTPDHIYCLNASNTWTRINPSGDSIFSQVSPITPKVKPNTNEIFIKIRTGNVFMKFIK